ncbi:MAG: EAL domain-containing protein [Rhodocyclaceae bacterium]|nr:EAL domain-containing protein [Rhodocyclaceae bacterium]
MINRVNERRRGARDRRLEASAAHTAATQTLAARETEVRAGEHAADQREGVADQREGAADQREGAADQREETANLRQEAADLREEVADLREEAAKAEEALSLLNAAHMREANERLIVATIHAQTMTEAAEQATAQMAYVAKHDFLTGLPNRSLLSDRLEQAIALARRHGKRLALMYLDLDHFKHINDSLGHAVGDELLQSAAKRLQACVRHSDTVSRQGGDEFVVLLSEVEAAQDAAHSAEKLLKTMAEPHLIGGHRLHVTLSIGISIYPDDGKDSDTMVRNADTAMYHAKNKGRNNYQRFTPDMNARAVARQSVEMALRRALEQREFVLHYQPKVNLETGAITGAEALVRLQQADRSLVGPTEFVSIAEDCGLILPLGKWVLREACRQTAAWLQAGLDVGQIAVNISAQEFHNKDFLAGVRAILNDTGLDPRHLELEVTESGLMQDTEPTMGLLHALNDLGVQIAVDDFGTGYSSLSYLRRFPIDTLKIDQSFVKDMDGNADEAIISAIIAMGKSLNLRVVAEGIETPQQLAFLKTQHCAEGQGYIFSQPVAAKDFAVLLAGERP